MRLLTNRRINASAACFDQCPCLVARKTAEGSGQHKLLARETLVESITTRAARVFCFNSGSSQPITKRSILFIGEPVAHTFSNRQPDLRNRVELLHRHLREAFERTGFMREDPGSAFADVSQPEPVDQIRELTILA